MMHHLHKASFIPVRVTGLLTLMTIFMFTQSCTNSQQDKKTDSALVRFMMLDPGHFHAALLQKSMYSGVDSTVHVFAPAGPDLNAHLALINQYNKRADSPTAWKEQVYSQPDYLQKMLTEKPGNVVVIAGNNLKKMDYIKKSVDAGLNVLADKPMAINTADFDTLKAAFTNAKKNGVLLYDIMTERYEINNALLKAFSRIPGVFGELKKGTAEDPAVQYGSVHYFFKQVSGTPLIRPAWYFDVNQEGEGIVDVTTHMVDLIQWECFPDVVLDYQQDVQMLSAKHWATALTLDQFRKVTNEDAFPDFLQKDVKDGMLQVNANGEMNYTLKGIHVRVSVIWNYEPPEGAGDTFDAKLQGTKANLVIRQGKAQGYKPVLYIEPANTTDQKEWKQALDAGLSVIQKEYPGVALKQNSTGWEVVVPEKYNIGHEQHFALVIHKYLHYLQEGNMPQWEISGMLAKYYTTTRALEMALKH